MAGIGRVGFEAAEPAGRRRGDVHDEILVEKLNTEFGRWIGAVAPRS